MTSTDDFIKLDPDSVQLSKMWVRKGELHLMNTMSFNVPKDLNNQINKILSDYLKRARLALRVLGGDVDWPLFSAASVIEWKKKNKYFRNPGHHTHEIIKEMRKINSSESKDICYIKDIILPGKIDIDSLSLVFCEPSWGSQDWKNLSKRFKDHYKPKMVLAFLVKRL